jgi:hypothetical protein
MNSKYDTSNLRISVEYSRKGQRDMRRLNNHGERVNPFTMIRDLAEYIEHHHEAGDLMIEEFTVRYDDGTLVTAYLSQGTYYIIQVEAYGKKPAVFPVYVWERIKIGCRCLLAQVFVGWAGVYRPLQLVTTRCY